ncbi:MAG: HD domain-containing phosphohydrolase [Spirochaetota bacterium]
MHDIGKVAVPDIILRKPTALNPKEFEIMKLHTTAGAMAFDHAIHESDNYLFRMGKRICLHHHERWDGGGYPLGLSGDAIPLEARIMALADVYDALLSKRVYKQAFSYGRAISEIKKDSGLAFDPVLTSVMLDNISQFQTIHEQFYDTEPVSA